MYKFNYNYPQIARDSGFKLQQFKDGPLDWRLMGSLETERILRDQSFEHIDSILFYLSEAPLGSLLETHILDSGIAKYFILSQLSIQYLLFCRKFLDETVRKLRESLVEAQTDNGKVKKAAAEANNEILQLHKKITQMEAIHEVVFPCHICTKNFLTNDALNIHLSRKHLAKSPCASEATTKDKTNDRNLINTIKLELEIKHLKERLNIAEKDIREKSLGNSRHSSPREVEENSKKCTRNIGIQNNLMDAKEKDDSKTCEDAMHSEKEKQLMELQEKVTQFEGEAQMMVDQVSISEINRKLQEISQVLAATKEGSTLECLEKVAAEVFHKSAPMQSTASPSIEDLDKLLSEKLSKIGRENSEQLGAAVRAMENAYKQKLNDLELEIRQKNEAIVEDRIKVATTRVPAQTEASFAANFPINSDINSKKSKVPITSQGLNQDDSNLVYRAEVQSSSTNDYLKNPSHEVNNEMGKQQSFQSIEEEPKEKNVTVASPKSQEDMISPKSREDIISPKRHDDVISLSSLGSDRTFVKETMSQGKSVVLDLHETDESSESSPQDEYCEEEVSGVVNPANLQQPTAYSTKMNHTKESKVPIKKQFNRKNAKKIADNRLRALGIDVQSKGISSATMNRVSAELSDHQDALKQIYPNFFPTRCRIKKFINKLCLPSPMPAVLMRTAAVPKAPIGRNLSAHDSQEKLSAEDVGETLKSESFKERLEHILSSPICQPNRYTTTKVETFSLVHPTTSKKPIPIPRKRVMFTTSKSISSNDNSDDSSPISIGKVLQKQHH